MIKVELQQETNSHGLQPVDNNQVLQVLACIFAYSDGHREAKIVTKLKHGRSDR